MVYNKFINLGTVERSGVVLGEVFARKVESDKYILFRLTYEQRPQVVGLCVPSTIQDLIKYGFLSNEDAKKLKLR